MRDIRPGSGNGVNSTSNVPVPLANGILFFADDGSTGVEPWFSDGTAAGTYLLRDVRPGAASSDPLAAGAAGGLAWFAADDGVVGHEPFRTDGTPAGTVRIADVEPGRLGSVAYGFEVGGGDAGVVVFSAWRADLGVELWAHDPRRNATWLLGDLVPGPLDSSPLGFRRAGTRLWFGVEDHLGREPWVLELRDLEAAFVAPFGAACPGTLGWPRAAAAGVPVLGNSAFALTLAHARPGAPAALLLGGTRARLPLGSCSLLVGSPLVPVSTTSDASGAARVGLPIPASTALLGGESFAQWVIADPQGALFGALAASDGLQVLLGR